MENILENTLENKAKLFAQYWGQRVLIRNINNDQYDDKIRCMQYYWSGWESSSLIELTSLSSISDEDAIEVAKLCYIEIDDNLIDGYLCTGKQKPEQIKRNIEKWTLGLGENYNGRICDYLRSKGYALPWRGLAVEQQIEYGWIKLKIK